MLRICLCLRSKHIVLGNKHSICLGINLCFRSKQKRQFGVTEGGGGKKSLNLRDVIGKHI